MKRSITLQFSVIFISILTGTILICLIANVLFLKDFYLVSMKEDFIEAYEAADSAAADANIFNASFLAVIDDIGQKYNMSILVLDHDSRVVISSNEDEHIRKQLVSQFVTDFNEVFGKVEEISYYFVTTKDEVSNVSYLEMYGTFRNGYHFLFRAPLENLDNDALIANQFLVQASAIAMFFGVCVIVYMTSRITSPIKELANISKRMAKLDFSAKYEPTGDNEIDMLGRHMNVLSDKLEKTISELKTANNELKRDIEIKEMNEELRKEFVANVSHELKTPIALIQGYAEGLRDGIHDDAQSREFYCEVIMDEANRMNHMVRNLLNLSEIEAGKNVSKMERFDLSELADNLLRSMELTFEQEEIRLEKNYESGVYVWADEFQVEEVFRNYLTNATHHVSKDKVISVNFTRYENRIRVTVYNSGEPIPEESIPYIWDKFYKVDKARTREYGGSGVGLSIVKAIMESTDCKYGVYNHENGVSFYFEVESK